MMVNTPKKSKGRGRFCLTTKTHYAIIKPITLDVIIGREKIEMIAQTGDTLYREGNKVFWRPNLGAPTEEKTYETINTIFYIETCTKLGKLK